VRLKRSAWAFIYRHSSIGIPLGCLVGRFGVGMPVGQVTCTEMFIKVLHELGAVVGQDVLEREGEEEGGKVEEVLGRMSWRGSAWPKPGRSGRPNR